MIAGMPTRKHSTPIGKNRPLRSRRKGRPPRTAEQFLAAGHRFQNTWNRVNHVLTKMRASGLSLSRASREVGIAPKTVTRYAKSGLRRLKSGRYAVKGSDALLRLLRIPTSSGVTEIAVRSSREASKLANYWVAVDDYLATGDSYSIEKFRNQFITDASGAKVPLVTDLEELDRLGRAGVLSFESLYARGS